MIIRVRRFDPPAWAIAEWVEDGDDLNVTIFSGVYDYLKGNWFVDWNSDDWWSVNPDEMPDEVCADLAKWRLSQ